MAKLLEGVRVLDLTNVLSGPLCTYQLAQLGAEVIKVEVPGSGDLARQLGSEPRLNRRLLGASFLAQNAGKKSVTLNLKSVEGKDIFRKLVAKSDVVVENFRPGVMERIGLGHAELRKTNARLIYCCISGFGQEGPLSGQPAYDQVVQGFSGIMSITGSDESGPLRAGYPASDTTAGITAAMAIAAALYRSVKTGEGEVIDVSMLEATLVSLGWVVSNFLTAGEMPKRMGNENMSAAPSGTFQTGDGMLNITANKQEHFLALCSVLGRDDLAIDPRFNDRDERRRNRAQLKPLLEEALSARSAGEWHVMLTKASIPAGPVLSVPEALDQPQIKERGFVRRFDNVLNLDRPIQVMRAGFKLAGGDPEPNGPPPTLGEHTREILAGLGIDEAELTSLRERKII